MPVTRDQLRAFTAYECVRALKQPGCQVKFDKYAAVVKDFGMIVRRSGLSAAVADVQRGGDAEGKRFFNDLDACIGADFPWPTAQGAAPALPVKIRSLQMADYLLCTREALKAVLWLKRAVQAEGTPAEAGS